MKRFSVYKIKTVVVFLSSIVMSSTVNAQLPQPYPMPQIDCQSKMNQQAAQYAKALNKVKDCTIDLPSPDASWSDTNSSCGPNFKNLVKQAIDESDCKEKARAKTIIDQTSPEPGDSEPLDVKLCNEARSTFKESLKEANVECTKIGGCKEKVERCNSAIKSFAEFREDVDDDDTDAESAEDAIVLAKEAFNACPSLAQEGLDKIKEDYEALKDEKKEMEEGLKEKNEELMTNTNDYEKQLNEYQTNLTKAQLDLDNFDAESTGEINKGLRNTQSEFNQLLDKLDELELAKDQLAEQQQMAEVELGKAKRSLQRQCSQFASDMVSGKRQSLMQQDDQIKITRTKTRGGIAKRIQSNKNYLNMAAKGRIKKITGQLDYYFNQCIRGKTKKLEMQDIKDDLKQTKRRFRNEQKRLKKQIKKTEKLVKKAQKDIPGIYGDTSKKYLTNRKVRSNNITTLQRQLLTLSSQHQKKMTTANQYMVMDQIKQFQFAKDFEAAQKRNSLHGKKSGGKNLDVGTTSYALELFKSTAVDAEDVISSCNCCGTGDTLGNCKRAESHLKANDVDECPKEDKDSSRSNRTRLGNSK